MKILLVTSISFHSTYGGGQVYVKNLVDEFVRQGLLPVIASPGNIGGLIEEYKGCTICTFNDPEVQTNYETLLPLLLEIRPDIVHAHGFKASFIKACKDLNISCIITAHHGGILCPAGALLNYRDEICNIKANHKDCLPCVLKNIRGGFYALPVLRLIPLKFRFVIGHLMEKLPFILYLTPVLKTSLSIQQKANEWETIYENASLIIAPSYGIADSMIRNGALPEKIKVLPHGIPLPDRLLYSKQKTERKNVTRPLRFFYVGRICYVKGVHVMLSAFDKLKGKIELHIIGGAGNKVEERYKQRLQKKYSHNSQIIWHEKVQNENIYSLIQHYDVMIHPAICLEIFGLNIAEALTLGKPVISTRCGGPEMQIEDGINGWLIKPNDVNELKSKMEEVISKSFKQMFNKKSLNLRVVSIEEHINQLKQVYFRTIYEKTAI